METAQHWDRLAKNQPAEITMFQISEVQESHAFNDRQSFLALRHHGLDGLDGHTSQHQPRSASVS